MAVSLIRTSVVLGLVCIAYKTAVFTNYAPTSWAIGSMCAWLSHTTVTGWHRMSTWEQRHLLWGMTSLLAFLHYLVLDPSFQSWEDVFFFCGARMEYCNCNFRWNSQGWTKAAVLWNFTLSTALALQKLVITLGLNGLLPGEDLVTKESFISIGWRLIPYWLNNWEQQWGAECSSMIFELPHFALELLVVLPCAQIIATRLKILALPHVRLPARRLAAFDPRRLPAWVQGAPDQQEQQQQEAGGRLGAVGGQQAPWHWQQDRNMGQQERQAERDDDLVPDPLRCLWVRDEAQRRLLPRLRANTKMMGVLVLITSVALFNAIVMPLALEGQVRGTARSGQITRLSEELSFVASKGRLAEMARWYEAFIEGDIRRAAAREGDNSSASGSNSSEPEATFAATIVGNESHGERLSDGSLPLANGSLSELTSWQGSHRGSGDGGIRSEAEGPEAVQPVGKPTWQALAASMPAFAPLLSWAERQHDQAAGSLAIAAAQGVSRKGPQPDVPVLSTTASDGTENAGVSSVSSENTAADMASTWAGSVARPPAPEPPAQHAKQDGLDQQEHSSAGNRTVVSSALAVSVLAMRVAGGAPWPSADNIAQVTAELAGADVGSAHAVDARLAVLCTLWEPLVPMHWLRAMHLAGSFSAQATNSSLLWALQFRKRPTTPALLAHTRSALATVQQQQQQRALSSELTSQQQVEEIKEEGVKAVEKLGMVLEELGESSKAAADSKRKGARGDSGRTPDDESDSEDDGGRTGVWAVSAINDSFQQQKEEQEPELAVDSNGSRGSDSNSQKAGLTVSELQANASFLGAAEADSSSEGVELARLLLAAVAVSDLDPSDPHALGEAWLELEEVAQDGVSDGRARDLAWLRKKQRDWDKKGCVKDPYMSPLYRALSKHAVELQRMQHPDHRALIPLVEVALALMRLSCENFFSLAAVFVGYLLFRDPPPMAQHAILGVARLSHIFQRAILYAFPAVCWSYGAGFVFSSFVSVVFWTGPLLRALERMRTAATSVLPRAWHPATQEELERMGGQCAICWGDMAESAGSAADVPTEPHPAAAEAVPGEASHADYDGAEASGRGGGTGEETDGIAAAAAGDVPATGIDPQASLQSASQPDDRHEDGAGAGEGLGPAAVEGPPVAAAAADEVPPEAAAGEAFRIGELGIGTATEEEEGLATTSTRAMGLPCGHAYHEGCLLQWLHQCYGQARQPTCPMCQATIRLKVTYRLPFAAAPPQEGGAARAGDLGEGGAGGAEEQPVPEEQGIAGIQALVRALQDDFRNRFEPVLVGPDHQDFLAWEAALEEPRIPVLPPPQQVQQEDEMADPLFRIQQQQEEQQQLDLQEVVERLQGAVWQQQEAVQQVEGPAQLLPEEGIQWWEQLAGPGTPIPFPSNHPSPSTATDAPEASSGAEEDGTGSSAQQSHPQHQDGLCMEEVGGDSNGADHCVQHGCTNDNAQQRQQQQDEEGEEAQATGAICEDGKPAAASFGEEEGEQQQQGEGTAGGDGRCPGLVRRLLVRRQSSG